VVCQHAAAGSVDYMEEYKLCPQTGACYPSIAIGGCPGETPPIGNPVEHKQSMGLRTRYVINRCHVCRAVISDANRNRLTDQLCDGCMWIVQQTGTFYILRVGKPR